MGPKPRPVAERFWEKVLKADGDGCWMWKAMRSPKSGYGLFAVRFHPTRYVVAHRIAYALANGEFPAELDVLHKCDNPTCVRPDHLFLGTQADNNRDMKAKGRAARGTAHFRAKLDPAKVVDIRRRRRAGETLKSIANRLGVSPETVSAVVTGRTWSHVPDAG